VGVLRTLRSNSLVDDHSDEVLDDVLGVDHVVELIHDGLDVGVHG
jgi:hypothetical protein